MDRERIQKRVAVIGAGVTGLTTAWQLRKLGHEVVVIERSGRPGGSIHSMRKGEWLVEGGPNTMLLNDPAVLEFFHRIGLAKTLVDANKVAKHRFIVRGGQPIAAPMSPIQFFKTKLLSGGAKWRLFIEPFVRRARPEKEESVAQFARRRLGREVVDYAINPLIGGIYAGDPDQLAIAYAFPKLHRFDRDHGSLLSGALAARRERRAAGRKKFKSRSISFRNGLQEIIDALVRIVGDSLFTQSNITSIRPGPPWSLTFERAGEGPTTIEADAIVVTIPGYAAAELPFPSEAEHPLAALAEITYPPVTSLALGFRRDQIRHPLDGYGVLVPACEGFRILGTLFSSSLFPGRAPQDSVLLSTFVGGMRQPDLARKPFDELKALVLEDLNRLLGVSGEPALVQMTAWERAIPQYNLGYARFHEAMEKAERRLPGLFVGGHIRSGVSVGDCIRAGLDLATRATD